MSEQVPRQAGAWVRAGFYSPSISALLFLLGSFVTTGELLPRVTQGKALMLMVVGAFVLFVVLPGCFTFLLFFFEGHLTREGSPNLVSRSAARGFAASVLSAILSGPLVHSMDLVGRNNGIGRAVILIIAILVGPALIIGYVGTRSSRS